MDKARAAAELEDLRGEIGGIDDLPEGWTERQEAGRYRLEKRQDDALFGYVAGPHSFKPWFFPPRETLFRAERRESGFESIYGGGDAATAAPSKLALVGARSCDLHALAIQDRVFAGGPYADAGWVRRRADVFVVAINCGEAGGTCFCVSMETGPRATAGYDLALTELLRAGHLRPLLGAPDAHLGGGHHGEHRLVHVGEYPLHLRRRAKVWNPRAPLYRPRFRNSSFPPALLALC